MPTKTWVVGEETIAADFNAMVQRQVVATFPNAAARDAAIPAPSVGMVCHLADTGRMLQYTDKGGAPAWRLPWGEPWGHMFEGAPANMANVTGSQWVAGSSAPVGPVGGRLVRYTFAGQVQNLGGVVCTAAIGIQSAAVDDLARSVSLQVSYSAIFTLSHLYVAAAGVSTQAHVASDVSPCQFTAMRVSVEDLGPAV